MPNQQLVEYIRQARASGQNDVDIKNALLNAGWQEGVINELLAGLAPFAARPTAVSRSPKMIVTIASAVAALLLVGGGFVYWYFAYEPKQDGSQQQATQEVQREQQTLQQEVAQKIVIVPGFYKDVSEDIQLIRLAIQEGKKWKDDACLVGADYAIGIFEIMKSPNAHWFTFASQSSSKIGYAIALDFAGELVADKEEEIPEPYICLNLEEIKISSLNAFEIAQNEAKNKDITIQENSYLDFGLYQNDHGPEWRFKLINKNSGNIEKRFLIIINAMAGEILKIVSRP